MNLSDQELSERRLKLRENFACKLNLKLCFRNCKFIAIDEQAEKSRIAFIIKVLNSSRRIWPQDLGLVVLKNKIEYNQLRKQPQMAHKLKRRSQRL